jgi:uncharacterized protein
VVPDPEAPTMRLDQRSPLVVNTHVLSRRPGAMRAVEFTVPAPADLGVELLGVPAGTPLHLRLRLESVMEGVLVSGSAEVVATGECARCLGPVEVELDVALQELYVYPESDAEEDEAARLDGELLDLEPVVRDAVVLALPFQPICRPDCPGLCPDCGVRLGDEPGHGHDEPVDARWAALVALTALTDEVDEAAAPAEVDDRDDEE